MENKCPNCHSTNIRNDSIKNNNGIIGPGYKSWLVEEKYSCNDCGVYFKPVAEKDLNLAVMGHGKPERAVTGMRWVKASSIEIKHAITYYAKWEDDKHLIKGTGWFQMSDGTFFWDKEGDVPIGVNERDNLMILDEQPAAGIKQINREWLCGILIDFTIAYVKSTNKDIANDAAEYIYDKLKDVGIEYVLSESEQPAAEPLTENARYELRLALRDMIKLVKRIYGDSAIPAEHQKRLDAADGLLQKHSKITDVLRTPTAGREEDAVAFHDWVLHNEWEINYREQRTHTTTELYDIFKKENP